MILTLFTLPHVVPNMYEFLSSAEHKRRYFEEYGYNQTVDGSHWLSYIFLPIQWKSIATVNGLVPYFFHTMEVNGYHRLFGSIFFPCYGSEWLPSTVWFHIFSMLWKWMATVDCLVPYFFHAMEVNGYRRLFGSIFFPCYGSEWLPSTVWFHIFSMLWKWMATVDCLVPYFFHAMEVNGYRRLFGSIFFPCYGSEWLPSTVWFHIFSMLWKWMATVDCLVPYFFPYYGSQWLPSTVWFHIFSILWKSMATVDCLVPYFFHTMEVNGYRRLFGSIFFPYYGSQWLPSTVWFHIFSILWKSMATVDCLVPYFFPYYGSQWLPLTVWFHIFSILWRSMATVDCLVPYFFHTMEVNGYHRLFGSIFFPCYGSQWLPSTV